jgi:hypothetical protein
MSGDKLTRALLIAISAICAITLLLTIVSGGLANHRCGDRPLPPAGVTPPGPQYMCPPRSDRRACQEPGHRSPRTIATSPPKEDKPR